MAKIDFYEDLSGEPPETMDLAGVMLAHENKGKWHACKKGATTVTFTCGSRGVTNPTGRRGSERNFKKNSKTVTPQQYLELGTLCKNCERIIQDEYNLVRVISAVPTDESDDAWKGISERFIRRASKEVETHD